MAFSPITSWQIDGEKVETVTLGSGSLLCCGFHSYRVSLMKLCPLFSRTRLLGDLAISQPVDA